MQPLDLVLIVLVIAHIGLAVWATRRAFLMRRLSAGKRVFLLMGIWLIPLIGPWIGRVSMQSLGGGVNDPIDSYAMSGHDADPTD